MSSQCEHLPSKLGGGAPHSDQRLHNDLGVLAAMNIGWSPDLVTTISASNLRDIIEGCLSSKFPSEDIAIPSVKWIRLQFSPRNPYAARSIRNTGRFEEVRCSETSVT